MNKFYVIVKTGANENKIEEGSEFKVYLKSRPVDGKANLELIKVLSKYFGKKVRIVSGFTSKKKLLEFEL